MDYWEEEEDSTAPILHIIVVGFHHQKGCSLEYVYPPFASGGSSSTSSLTNQLPSEWRHLPYLALPDGCHNYDEDASFFVLPSLGGTEPSGAVYGVACCRQIDSKDVEPSSEITRSTVQKSVCVLCRYPYYGSIEERLKGITQAYFAHKDFTNVSVLQDALMSMNGSFLLSKAPTSNLYVGLTQQMLVMRFGYRLLPIYKALLLQKKVLVCGLPAKDVCRTILSILSLFPRSTEDVVKCGHLKKDEFGFPLDIFPSSHSVQPYVCLQQMDALAGENSYALIGVANPLFQKQHSRFCDVFVHMEDGTMDISDPKLKASVYLTAADLRFCDYLTTSVRDVTSATVEIAASSWFGSNEWVGSQFRLYLLSLLATSLSARDSNLQEFGRDFVDNWLKGPVYTTWRLASKRYSGMSKVDPVHLCRGELTFNDLKLRLSAQATEYGFSDKSKEKVGAVWQQTQGVVGGAVGNMRTAVGGAWSAASSAVSSWWWTGEENDT